MERGTSWEQRGAVTGRQGSNATCSRSCGQAHIHPTTAPAITLPAASRQHEEPAFRVCLGHAWGCAGLLEPLPVPPSPRSRAPSSTHHLRVHQERLQPRDLGHPLVALPLLGADGHRGRRALAHHLQLGGGEKGSVNACGAAFRHPQRLPEGTHTHTCTLSHTHRHTHSCTLRIVGFLNTVAHPNGTTQLSPNRLHVCFPPAHSPALLPSPASRTHTPHHHHTHLVCPPAEPALQVHAAHESLPQFGLGQVRGVGLALLDEALGRTQRRGGRGGGGARGN